MNFEAVWVVVLQLVGIYCRGILPGLWPFIWSLVIMKVSGGACKLDMSVELLLLRGFTACTFWRH